MRKIILIFVYLTFFKGLILSESISGGRTLLLAEDARSLGMGGVNAGVVCGVNSLFYNPAGLGMSNRYEVLTMVNKGLVDTSNSFMGGVIPLKTAGIFGTGLFYYDGGDIELNWDDGTSQTNKAQQDYVLLLSFSPVIESLRVNDIFLGFTLKYLHSSLLPGYSETGTDYSYSLDIKSDVFAFDFGGMSTQFLGSGKLKLGAAIQNIGPKMKYKDKWSSTSLSYESDSGTEKTEGDALPLILKIGGGYEMPIGQGINLLVASDILKRDEDMLFNLGLEGIYKKMFALRVGYKIGYELDSFTVGLGLNYKDFSFDYGVGLMGELSLIQRVTFNAKFGKPVFEESLVKPREKRVDIGRRKEERMEVSKEEFRKGWSWGWGWASEYKIPSEKSERLEKRKIEEKEMYTTRAIFMKWGLGINLGLPKFNNSDLNGSTSADLEIEGKLSHKFSLCGSYGTFVWDYEVVYAGIDPSTWQPIYKTKKWTDSLRRLALKGKYKFPLGKNISGYGLAGFANFMTGDWSESAQVIGFGIEFDIGPRSTPQRNFFRLGTETNFFSETQGLKFNFIHIGSGVRFGKVGYEEKGQEREYYQKPEKSVKPEVKKQIRNQMMGTVQTKNNQMISGCLIEIFQGNKEIVRTQSDKDGYFETKELPSGLYRISAKKEGYMSQIQEIEVEEDGPATVDFILLKKISKKLTEAEKKSLMSNHFKEANQLYQQGKYVEAIEEWEKVLELDPNHKLSKIKIEKAREQLGK